MAIYYHYWLYAGKWKIRREIDTPAGPRLFSGEVEYNYCLSEQEIYDRNLWPADFDEWVKYHNWVDFIYMGDLFQERRDVEVKQANNELRRRNDLLKEEGNIISDFRKMDADIIFDNIQLFKPSLCWSILRGLDLQKLKLDRVDFRWADLSEANLTHIWLPESYFRGADLSCSNLMDAYLFNCDLSNSNLSKANLTNANIARSNLRGAYLRGANLSGADLHGSDLTGIDLTGIDLTNTDLSWAIVDKKW